MNLSIQFAFRYAEITNSGYRKEDAFMFVATEYKRDITAIKLTRRKGKPDSRTYYFSDSTSCIFENDSYFKFTSKN